MSKNDWMTGQFEENRPRLRAVAYRMLGSISEADDAVQEAWLRFARSETEAVENLTAWLTTVTSRICLDALRARRSRRENPIDEAAKPLQNHLSQNDPEQELLIADSVGLALLIVLETLDPAERVAFVLHDTFGVPFDEIARITKRSAAAARQLASRARRRVRGKSAAPNRASNRRREIVEAFYAAAREGNFEALLAVLDPDVTLRADRESSPSGAAVEVRGATAVGNSALAARIRTAEVALIDGQPGIIVVFGGRLQRALIFQTGRKGIAEIEIVGSEERLRQIEVHELPAVK